MQMTTSSKEMVDFMIPGGKKRGQRDEHLLKSGSLAMTIGPFAAGHYTN